MRTHSEFDTLTENVLRRLPRTFVGEVLKQEKIRSRLKMLCESLIQKENEFFQSVEISATSLKCNLLKENEWLNQNYVKQNHTIILLEGQKDHLLSKARSELDKQELRVESKDRALHESSVQLYSQRTERHQANKLSDQSQRERAGYAPNRTEEKRVLQEDRMRSLQEKEELKKMCCTEAQ